MTFKVIRANTKIKVGAKSYATGAEFEAEEEAVKTLLKNKFIKKVKNGKSINS